MQVAIILEQYIDKRFMRTIFTAFFAIIIATANATESNGSTISITNKIATNNADAIIAKLKALTENYKKKVNAARNVNELLAIATEYGEKAESLAYECNDAYADGHITKEEHKKCEGFFYKYASEVNKACRNKRAALNR